MDAVNNQLMILLEQLKLANKRWKLLEEERVRVLEIFLSLIVLTGFALFVSNLQSLFLLNMEKEIRLLIPIIFLLAGLCFYVLFWYREIDLRISKSWIKRIEEEIRKLYKGENSFYSGIYDGAYFLNYYEASKHLDLVINFQGFAIFGLTTSIVVITSNIFSSDLINIFFWACIISFPVAKLLLRIIADTRYRRNSEKYPPTMKSSINLSSILKESSTKDK